VILAPGTPVTSRARQALGCNLPGASIVPTSNHTSNHTDNHTGNHTGNPTSKKSADAYICRTAPAGAWGGTRGQGGNTAPPPPRTTQGANSPLKMGWLVWQTTHAYDRSGGAPRTCPEGRQTRSRPRRTSRAGTGRKPTRRRRRRWCHRRRTWTSTLHPAPAHAHHPIPHDTSTHRGGYHMGDVQVRWP
jgi:hypothetical protein